MASLMEELITVLSREKEIYEKLIPISERKTVVLIREDLQELQKVTDEEQQLLDAAYAADKKREKIIENIGIVLNRDPKELDLTTLARLMARRSERWKIRPKKRAIPLWAGTTKKEMCLTLLRRLPRIQRSMRSGRRTPLLLLRLRLLPLPSMTIA